MICNKMIHDSGTDLRSDKGLYTPFHYLAVGEKAWTSSSEECRIHNVFNKLSHLEDAYPGFKGWYNSKVIPGLTNGTRQILAEYHGDQPVALVIAKRSTTERKLCTIWVDENERGSRASQALIGSAVKWLDCNRPLVTATESAREMLHSTFRRFGFKETGRKFGMYSLESAEYFYNSKLSFSWRN
jgi:hypothetical protein